MQCMRECRMLAGYFQPQVMGRPMAASSSPHLQAVAAGPPLLRKAALTAQPARQALLLRVQPTFPQHWAACCRLVG